MAPLYIGFILILISIIMVVVLSWVLIYHRKFMFCKDTIVNAIIIFLFYFLALIPCFIGFIMIIFDMLKV